MPPTITNMGQLVEIVRTGDTQVTLQVMAALAAGAVGTAGSLVAWRHWKKVQQPGHFDTIDGACRKRAGLSKAEARHLDHDVPSPLKERARRLIVASMERGFPLKIKMKAAHPGEEPALHTYPDGTGILMTFEQPI